MLNKYNLNIAKLAPKEANRFTLNAIRVTPTETIVTDGHLLMRVTHAAEFKADQFPNREDSGLTPVEDFAPFNLSADKALDAIKSLPKRSRIPILQCAAVMINSDPSHPKVVTTDLEDHSIYSSVDGNFPDIDRVMPKAENTKFSIALDPHKVKALMEQYIGMLGDAKQTRSVRFDFQDARSALTMTATQDGQTMTAVLMPVKMPEPKKDIAR